MFRTIRTIIVLSFLILCGSGPVLAENDLDTPLADEQYFIDGQPDYNNAGVNKQTAAFTGDQGADFGRVRDPREAVARVVQSFLVLLGTLFLVYAVYAGYLILTSMGNEERIEKGKHILRNTVIGLTIILAAYGTTWIVKWMFVATGDTTYKNCHPPVYEDFNGNKLEPLNYDNADTNC